MTIKQLLTLILASVFVLAPTSILSAEEELLSTLGCILIPSEKVQVSAPVPGVLDKVHVQRGDTIKKGNTLFQLKAAVEKEGVKLASIRAEFAIRIAKRNKALYADDILTMHERDEIETELLIAKSELRLKKQELALRTVYSPISGVVVNRFNNTGEYVNIDPILDLATLDPLYIDLLLPASYFGQIVKGQKLMIKLQSDAIDAGTAKVIIVDPLIDSASGTFRVQLMMSNPGNKIPAGIHCTAQLINKL